MSTVSPYKRRKHSLLRNLWVYRRLVLAAIVLGLILWFTKTNSTQVLVYFPFGTGSVSSTTGMIILASTLAGAVVGSLVTAVVMSIKLGGRRLAYDDEGIAKPAASGSRRDDDLPPADYAVKTPDGLSPPPWS